ncbi:MAG: type-F conjugative transfer system secretin TraK [Deltaproteobacteria bacterium]|nr:type-F conjugative transfer system secretin TraK [Deltaproteobacteria bacterium]
MGSKAISLVLALILLVPGLARGEEAEPPKNAVDQTKNEDIPAVPAKIMAALNRINRGRRPAERQSGLKVEEGDTVQVEPGRNVILPVAGGHLNRLVTPFENPTVHTVSKAKISVEGSVIYVSLAQDDGPTTMFVTESGESDPSLSLTLVPRAMPPREIRLTLGGSASVVSLSGKSAKWEKNQPYIEAIEQVMLRTARGEVPPGYSLRHPLNYDPAPQCRLPVRVEPRQVLEGHNFLVTVSRMTNVSSASLLVDESACYREGVRAVAVWPRVRLNPQESTELYVLYQRDFGQKPRVRPNVLQMTTNRADQPDKPKKAGSRPEPVGLSFEDDQNRP